MSAPPLRAVVTGTGTEVGKTVVTAALAAVERAAGHDVTVVKPAQTGMGPEEPGDLADVARLAGVASTVEWARYPDPLSPEAAARVSGLPALGHAALLDHAASLPGEGALLVEGAGGLLVRFDSAGTTIADLARALALPVVLVCRAGLGSLNEVALTLEALERRSIPLAGLVVGSWPAHPGLAERCNVADLETLAGRPLDGVITAGAGLLAPADFALAAAEWLGPRLGGRFDARGFRDRWAPGAPDTPNTAGSSGGRP